MLHPLRSADLEQATGMLVEGFPERSEAFWHASFDSIRRHGGNAAADFPCGFLWLSRGQPAGVALTPAVLRTGRDGATRRLVNISSWYVRRDERWRAPLMLKSLLKAENAVFTDLTPSPAVKMLLPGLGFRPINHGTRITALAVAALLPRRGARVDVLPPQAEPAIMGSHRELGCVPVLVEGAGSTILVVYRSIRMRGIPTAELLYVESHRKLAERIGILARHLLGQGHLLMRAPAIDEPGTVGSVVLQTGHWFAHGDYFDDHTDVLGSERTLFDP